MKWLAAPDGSVHIYRSPGAWPNVVTWCGRTVPPTFVAEPKQHQKQCMKCQDAAWKERS
jgi:hypothetical protein